MPSGFSSLFTVTFSLGLFPTKTNEVIGPLSTIERFVIVIEPSGVQFRE